MTWIQPRPARQPLPFPAPVTGWKQAERVSTDVVAQPKGEKAKPGKTAPTAQERAWMDYITGAGCIACRIDGHQPRPTAVHHILRGGVRMGHLHTLALCDPGHHQGGQALGLISRHPHKAKFEAIYGGEYELLDRMRLAYAIETRRAV